MKVRPILPILILSCAFAAGRAEAAETAWQDLGGGRARMLAVQDPQTMEIGGIVEIELSPGWKTYWREPGGSGIPPSFDFSGSRHFLAGEIAYPVPEKLRAGGSVFAGYEGTVRFVFDGRVNGQSDESGAIRLNLLAGICDEICIPATAEFTIEYSELVQSDPQAMRALLQAKTSLPSAPNENFRIAGGRVEGDKLVIDAVVPEGPDDPALFAEGPRGWYLRPAELTARDGRNAEFQLTIGDIPNTSQPAFTRLRYTLVSGDAGIEQWFAPEQK